jgi:hypothetical protein
MRPVEAAVRAECSIWSTETSVRETNRTRAVAAIAIAEVPASAAPPFGRQHISPNRSFTCGDLTEA